MVNWTLSNNFINSSGTVATIVNGLFVNVGGSWFLTIMLIMLFVILISIIMRVPFELTSIFILPLFLVCYVYVPDFTAITGVLLIYVGVLLGKNFFMH